VVSLGVAPRGGRNEAKVNTQPKTQKRVPNHKLESLMAQRLPFDNYNASISAELIEGVYRIWHWKTHILTYDTNTNEVVQFDFRYYSQTTSALQGKILRAIFSRSKIEEFHRSLIGSGDTKSARRLRGMVGIGR
jgi:hypothetical protein